jgi:hypothetical protein
VINIIQAQAILIFSIPLYYEPCIAETDKALHMKLGSARPLFMKFEGKVNWDSPVPTLLTSDPFRL